MYGTTWVRYKSSSGRMTRSMKGVNSLIDDLVNIPLNNLASILSNINISLYGILDLCRPGFVFKSGQ